MTAKKSSLLEKLLDYWLTSRLEKSEPDETSSQSIDELFGKLSRAEHAEHVLQAAWPSKTTSDLATKADTSATAMSPALADAASIVELGQFGRFEVQRLLGSGGMAQVFLAFDPTLRRPVALKIPHPGLMVSERARDRLLREARAAGMLRHANIVAVYESGQAGAICYIASQFCSGPTLAEWLRDRDEPVPQRLAATIVSDLANAMQHAHDRRILHRDLKPGNVLLDPVSDGTPADEEACDPSFPFRPRIADFGLALIEEEDETLTKSGFAFGTPAYMSPEQAAGKRELIGPRADVYGLGVILYELLTGQGAFVRHSLIATLAAVQEEEAIPPRRIRLEIPRDLEAICLKAMDKTIERRYHGAGDLADDLQRFLRGEPVQARSIGVCHRLAKSVRRHPALAALQVGMIVSAVVGLTAILWHNYRLGEALNEAEQMRQQARDAQSDTLWQQHRLAEELYATDIGLAYQAWKQGDVRDAFGHLRRYRPGGADDTLDGVSSSRSQQPPKTITTDLDAAHSGDLRGWEWHFLWQHVHAESIERVTQKGAGYFICFSPDGKSIATAGQDAVVRMYDATSLEELLAIDAGQGEVNGVAYSSDATRLASAGDDRTVRVWDLRTKNELLRIDADTERAYAALFTQGDRRLVTCGRDPVIHVWDALSGELIQQLEGHLAAVEAISLSPNGRHLASVSSDESVKIWDLKTGVPLHSFPAMEGRGSCVEFSPNGEFLAAGDISGKVFVLRSENAELVFSETHLDGVQTVAFSHDGMWLTVGTRSGDLRHWPMPGEILAVTSEAPSASDAENMSWQAHEGRIYRVAYAPDDDRLATIGQDGKVKLWRPRHRDPATRTALLDQRWLADAALLPDSNLLTLGRQELAILHRDTLEFRSVDRLPEPNMSCLAVSPDGASFAVGGHDGHIYRGDLTTGFETSPWALAPGREIYQLAFTPDGARLLVKLARDALEMRDAQTGQLERTFAVEDCHKFAISPNGRWLAGSQLDDIVVWDLFEQGQPRRLVGHTSTTRALTFSPDGTLLASASHDRRIKIWRWPEGVQQHSIEGLPAVSPDLCFSPDGRTLFSAGVDLPVTLWHVATGRELFTIEKRVAPVFLGPRLGEFAGLDEGGSLWLCDW